MARLLTFYTVFVIDLASRRVEIVGSTPHPDQPFMERVVRTLVAGQEGLARPASRADLTACAPARSISCPGRSRHARVLVANPQGDRCVR